jgi:metal-sulfur cluster biosynthetic enzyme
MTLMTTSIEAEVMQALSKVMDPELDEPITDLGFVRSVLIHEAGVTVHLRLPTSFCSPNFAYLMASDTQDALRFVEGVGRISVLLDDHHDSDKINAGLAADAGYVGTFGSEADESLDALRLTFQRKAHTAAMERCVSALLKSTELAVDEIHALRLSDLPSGAQKDALLRRRVDIGLGIGRDELVVVDDAGSSIPQSEVPLKLRFAKSVRISIEGNAHFCRGLLATRYVDTEPHGMSTHVTNTRRAS